MEFESEIGTAVR